MQFDLINDLNIDKWPSTNQISWQGLGTSLVAVIAGNISYDLDKSYQTVLDISKYYRHVLFVDGINEHNNQPNINNTRNNIREKFSKYRNISYLYRNPIVLDQVAFIGANGWTSFDFGEPTLSKQDCFYELTAQGIPQDVIFEQWEMSLEDTAYIGEKVAKLTKDDTIKKIVIVTNTIPIREIGLLEKTNPLESAITGSSFLKDIVSRDQNKKIDYWVFGNTKKKVFQKISNITFISNPRGNFTSQGNRHYYPELIKV
jgi:hypothetical protein